MSFKVPEQHRIKSGQLGSSALDGNNGAFMFNIGRVTAFCIASDGAGWEHVSISINKERTPDWEEMCFVKNLFWSEDDCVIQYHPPKKDYVNNAEYCLHLWRPIGVEIPRPPVWMIGIK